MVWGFFIKTTDYLGWISGNNLPKNNQKNGVFPYAIFETFSLKFLSTKYVLLGGIHFIF